MSFSKMIIITSVLLASGSSTFASQYVCDSSKDIPSIETTQDLGTPKLNIANVGSTSAAIDLYILENGRHVRVASANCPAVTNQDDISYLGYQDRVWYRCSMKATNGIEYGVSFSKMKAADQDGFEDYIAEIGTNSIPGMGISCEKN
jgi:hypothetical protein